MVRRFVWSINLVNEEVLAHWGLSRQKQQETDGYRPTTKVQVVIIEQDVIIELEARLA